jgi:hypothetical protein
VPHIFFRLSQAHLPFNALLHCAPLRFHRCSGPPSPAASYCSSKSSTPGFNPLDPSRWTRIWDFKQASNESCLLWKILYRANATQRWRFFSARSTDTCLHCILCVVPAVEDEAHLFLYILNVFGHGLSIFFSYGLPLPGAPPSSMPC